MARSQTADEVKVEFIEKFPEGTGELAHDLSTNLGHLHLNWKNYRTLYGTSQERIDLLNWAAWSFFRLLEGTLRRDVTLAIARLTDPAKSVGRRNASLAYLIEALAPSVDATVLDVWETKLEDLRGYCAQIRKIRNRQLAHDDLATALRYDPDPPAGLSRQYIEGALERLRNVLGAIEKHFRGCQTSHEYILTTGDGKSLVFRLEEARKHERCREREFEEKYGCKPGWRDA